MAGRRTRVLIGSIHASPIPTRQSWLEYKLCSSICNFSICWWWEWVVIGKPENALQTLFFFYFLETGALKLLLRDASFQILFDFFLSLLLNCWLHLELIEYFDNRAHEFNFIIWMEYSRTLELFEVVDGGDGGEWIRRYSIIIVCHELKMNRNVRRNQPHSIQASWNDAQCNYNVPVGVRIPFICESGILCANAVNVRRSSETNKLLRRKRARALIAFRFALPTNFLLIHYLLSYTKSSNSRVVTFTLVHVHSFAMLGFQLVHARSYRYRVFAINLSGGLDRLAKKDCVRNSCDEDIKLRDSKASPLDISHFIAIDLHSGAKSIYKQTNRKRSAITMSEGTMTAEHEFMDVINGRWKASTMKLIKIFVEEEQLVGGAHASAAKGVTNGGSTSQNCPSQYWHRK